MKAGEFPSKLPGGDHEDEGVEGEDDACGGEETPEEAEFYGQLAASREEGSRCVCDKDLVCATQQDDSTAPYTYYWSGPALFDLMRSVIMTITRGAP